MVGQQDEIGIKGGDGVGVWLLAVEHVQEVGGMSQTGPRREEPGYDAVMQAEGGLMSITGAADGPPYRLGVAIVDIVSGMFAAQGVLAALLARATTGEGQVVDIGGRMRLRASFIEAGQQQQALNEILHAGTLVELGIAEPISSRTRQRGETFALRLRTPLAVDGAVGVAVATPRASAPSASVFRVGSTQA